MASSLDKESTNPEMPTLLTLDTKSSRTRTSKTRRAILILLSLAAAAFYFYRNGIPFYQTPTSTLIVPEWPEDPIERQPFEPLMRYSLGYGKAACWQNGGVWIKDLTPVELSALGINRFEDTPRALEQADEDAFCKRLRMYGASFWQLPPQWSEGTLWCPAIDYCAQPTKNMRLSVGFPTSGGVWTLNMDHDLEALYYPQIRGLQNALTMDERCEVIKDLGGRFCEDIQTCPEMAPLLEPYAGPFSDSQTEGVSKILSHLAGSTGDGQAEAVTKILSYLTGPIGDDQAEIVAKILSHLAGPFSDITPPACPTHRQTSRTPPRTAPGFQSVNLVPNGEYKCAGAPSAKVASISPTAVLRLFDGMMCSDRAPD
ncbi:hypothetical protein F4808DRAFT_463715 [Astrocystis sublimbata]|nr:hypothetical protein F4808DRAFT_463715 [Astrocystis sublimbata]